MKLFLLTTALTLTILNPGTAMAKKDKAKHAENTAVVVLKGCPRGLAKKNNGCRPPDQLKRKNGHEAIGATAAPKVDHAQPQDTIIIRSEPGVTGPGEPLRVGSRLDPDFRYRFREIDNPSLFGLAPALGNWSYFRIGDTTVLVDNVTRVVVSLTALNGVLIK